MKSNIGISIHKPCHQNWDKMQPSERGRFCNACAKSVVDVTNWSKENILKEHLKSEDGLCIRIPESQLQSIKKQPVKWGFHRTFFISVLIFFSKLPIAKAFVSAPVLAEGNLASQDKSTKIHINGIVYDSTQTENRVAYATIVVMKGDEIISTAFTDSEGRYSIDLTKDSSLGDSITVECSHLAYATLSQKVKITPSLELDLYLKESTISLRTVVISRNRNREHDDEIIMGGMRMGSMSVTRVRPNLRLLNPYDTKTYYSEDLQRYNFNR